MRIYQAGPLFTAAEMRWHQDFKQQHVVAGYDVQEVAEVNCSPSKNVNQNGHYVKIELNPDNYTKSFIQYLNLILTEPKNNIIKLKK